MSQRGNEIGRLRPGEKVIDERVDDILNERAHLLEALDLEIARINAPQPRVLGR
jgi:hypothetical protein